MGSPGIPTTLPGRRELKERGIAAYDYGRPGDRHGLDSNARGLLLWSGFPDNTYQDSGARFSQHFEQIRNTMEAAWKATVMAIPKDVVVVTPEEVEKHRDLVGTIIRPARRGKRRLKARA